MPQLCAGPNCTSRSTRAGVPRGQTARPQLAGGPYGLPPPRPIPPPQTQRRPLRTGQETAAEESRIKPQTIRSPSSHRPENQLSKETGSRIERGRTSAGGQPGRARTRSAAVAAELKQRRGPRPHVGRKHQRPRYRAERSPDDAPAIRPEERNSGPSTSSR